MIETGQIIHLPKQTENPLGLATADILGQRRVNGFSFRPVFPELLGFVDQIIVQRKVRGHV
jgi:hypothetical protein